MTCISNKKNLGVGRCSDLPSVIRGIITTPPDFKLTAEDIADQTVWQDAIADDFNSRIYLWPLFATVPENRGTDTTYEDTPVGYNHVLDGRYRWACMISKSLCFHKNAFTHRSTTDRVWLIDARNNVIGTYVGDNEDGDAQYAGFSLDLLNVENLLFNDGTVSTKTPVIVALKDPNEVNDSVYGAFMFKVSFINLLSPLTDVYITVTAQTTTDITVTVKIKCDDTPVSGLVLADFVVTKASDGTSQTVDTVTETDDGTYVIHRNASVYVDGFVDLVGPQALSVYPNSAYETTGLATVDIP